MKKVLRIWRAILVRLWRIIRASFSQERMAYIPANDSSDGVSKVIYQSKGEQADFALAAYGYDG